MTKLKNSIMTVAKTVQGKVYQIKKMNEQKKEIFFKKWQFCSSPQSVGTGL